MLTDCEEQLLKEIEALRLKNHVLTQLVNYEWVDCDKVQAALGIDFSEGLKRFKFSRMAQWNPFPLNGQKITTRFQVDPSKAPRCPHDDFYSIYDALNVGRCSDRICKEDCPFRGLK